MQHERMARAGLTCMRPNAAAHDGAGGLRCRAQPALGQCSLLSWKPTMHTMHTQQAQIKPTGMAKCRQPQSETDSRKPCSSILGESSSATAPDSSGGLDLPKMEQEHGPLTQHLHQQLPKVTPRASHADGGEQLWHPAVQPPPCLLGVETRDGRHDTWGRTSSTTTCHCSL